MKFESQAPSTEGSKRKQPSGIVRLAAAAALSMPGMAQAEDSSIIEERALLLAETITALRSGETTIDIGEYRPVSEQVGEIERGEGAFETLTQAIERARTQAQTLLESFYLSSVVFGSKNHEDGAIPGYASNELFTQMLPQLENLQIDIGWIETQFNNLTQNGEIRLDQCREYGLPECVATYEAFREWQTETGLVPLTEDIASIHSERSE